MAVNIPDAIVPRVIGSTYDAGLEYPDDFIAMPRGMQVAGDAANRRPRGWIALDDDYIDWPPEHRHQLIKTDPYEGISKPFVTKLLTRKLADLCS